MIKAATDDISKGWIYDAHRGFDPITVAGAVYDHISSAEWQKHRVAMKGKPTAVKLQMLKAWHDDHIDATGTRPTAAAQIQIDNYLGALRRGGQLDDNNLIRKYI